MSTRPPARSGTGLPFGAVMATGAAAQLCDLVGVAAWAPLFVVLTIVIAAAVTVTGVLGLRRPGALRVGFGHFTIPVGLGVIAVTLAGADAPAPAVLRTGCAVAAWASTAVLLVAVVGHLPWSRPGLAAVNGVWFIAPAALLADAAAAVVLVPAAAPAAADAAVAVAVWCVWCGVAGYAVLLVVAAVRVVRHRFAGAPGVAWWIVTGCGGLAADALGHVAVVDPGARSAFTVAAVACWTVATIVFVPIGVGSVLSLWRRRRVGGAWPPAFSSGVYALGTAQVALLLPAPGMQPVAVIVAVETLVVWVAIAAVHVSGGVRTRQTVRSHRG